MLSQSAGRPSPLTPTLSRQREREHARLGSLSRVLVGEGWGEGVLSYHGLWLKLLANREAN